LEPRSPRRARLWTQAASPKRSPPENLAILFAALFPERAFDEIETASEMPTRALEQDKLGFRCLNG
jgi:hypothetical protein